MTALQATIHSILHPTEFMIYTCTDSPFYTTHTDTQIPQPQIYWIIYTFSCHVWSFVLYIIWVFIIAIIISMHHSSPFSPNPSPPHAYIYATHTQGTFISLHFRITFRINTAHSLACTFAPPLHQLYQHHTTCICTYWKDWCAVLILCNIFLWHCHNYW